MMEGMDVWRIAGQVATAGIVVVGVTAGVCAAAVLTLVVESVDAVAGVWVAVSSRGR
jgi:hypothetical protein